MDTHTLRQQIEQVLTSYTEVPFAHGDIQIQTIFDRERDRYLVMLVGTDGKRRVHGCLIHVDLIDNQIWIQRDGTEHGVARDFLELGIPKDQIVLATRSTPQLVAEIV